MNELLVSKGNKPRRGIVITCPCGKEAYRNPSRVSSTFCSVECKNKLSSNAKVYSKCLVCSKDFFRYQSQMRLRGFSGACSMKCRGLLLRGENSPQWIEDRSKVKCRPNGNADHKEWREKIFQRDDYTCQMCSSRGGYLEADHIKPWAYYPELRFELSNGRTLCKKCHDTTKAGPAKMKRMYEAGYWDAIIETQRRYNLRQPVDNTKNTPEV